MLKVIIADDEINVCRLIKNLVDWPSFDMEIVGMAHSGTEALKLVKTAQPDLIITDIRMPGLDGLELIRQAKDIRPGLEFIIISGYRHFEYAQNAIRYGVSDYLSKPIRKAELTDTLEKIRSKLLIQKNQLTPDEILQTRAQGDMEGLRSSLLLSLVMNQQAFFQDLTLDAVNRKYCCHFKEGLFQAFIVKLDHPLEGNPPEINVFTQNIRKILRNNLLQDCFDMETILQDDTVCGIVNYAVADQSKVRKRLKASLEEILLRRSIITALEVTLCLGPAGSLQQLPSSLQTAGKHVHQRLISGTGILIDEKPAEKNPPAEINRLLRVFARQLQENLELLDKGAMLQTVAAFQKGLLEIENTDGEKLYSAILEAYDIFLLFLQNQKETEGQLKEARQKFLEKARHTFSQAGLFQLLSDTLVQEVSAISDDKKQADAKPIRTAKQYIKSHYAEALSLEHVASVAGFNPSYFSSLFKKEAGINFQEYVTKVRMDKAKDLLRETNKSVSAICSEVGYGDLKHFTKGFKKYTGLSPNEFRKIYA